MFSKRIYCYQQLNQSDCGITCVRIIARYFGRRFSPSQLRVLCDSSRLGISIKDITSTFAKIGFNACPIRIGIEKLKEMPLPAILYWNQGHFVVLYRVAKDKFYIADPSSGKMRFREKEICEFWLSGSDTGVAILAEPNLESKDVEKSGYYINSAVWQLMCRLKESFGKNKSWFASIILLTLFSMCADIAVPLLFQKTVDSGISSKDIGLVWILVLSQLMIFLGNFVSSSLVQFIITKLGLHLGLQMMDEYLTKLVGMPMSFFCRRMPSDLIQKMDDQDRIKEFIVEMPGTIFLALISLIVFSSLLAYYCPIILFLLLFATACQIIWNNVFLRYIREIDYSRFASIAKSRNLVYEIVNGISEIKINGAQYVRLSVWRKLQMKVRDLAMRSFKVELVSNGGLSLISRIQDICVTGICATLVIQGNMTIGAMMTVGYIAGRLSQPFADIVNMCRRVQKTAMSVERVDDVVSADMPNPIGKEKLQMGDIHFKGVTFRYPGSGNPDVISNLCLSIPKGSTMAIVGSRVVEKRR